MLNPEFFPNSILWLQLLIRIKHWQQQCAPASRASAAPEKLKPLFELSGIIVIFFLRIYSPKTITGLNETDFVLADVLNGQDL